MNKCLLLPSARVSLKLNTGFLIKEEFYILGGVKRRSNGTKSLYLRYSSLVLNEESLLAWIIIF